MTVISSGVAFSAVKSIDVDVHGPRKDSEYAEGLQQPQGTPMMMQVSMVTTVVRPMTSAEFQAAMEFINSSKDSIKGLYKWGKGFYEKNEKTFKKIKGAFKAMQGVGDIVSGVKKFMPEEQDPMVQNLADLTTDVKALGEKLTDNFAEMKNFISQQTFFTDIMSPTSVLTMHMMDCLAYPGEDSKESFLAAYEKMSPMKMQYQFNSYLQQRTTNPLKLSMDSEKVKSRETFEKWEDIYCRVMAQFVILEAFAGGLLRTKSDKNFDRLIEASTEVLNSVEKWREEYETDQGYWEEMKAFLKPYLNDNPDMSNTKKVAELKAKLEKYWTRDNFYICIFGNAKWQKHYTYTCNNENEQMVLAWNNSYCTCIIYRSRTAYDATHQMYQELYDKMRACEKKLRWPGSLETVIKQQLTDNNNLPGDGFILLVTDYKDPVFDIVSNSSQQRYRFSGPGVTNHFTMENAKHKEYQMIVGFP